MCASTNCPSAKGVPKSDSQTLHREETWQVPRRMRNPCHFTNDVSQEFPELGLEMSLCAQGLQIEIYQNMWISCVFKFSVCRMKHTQGQVQASGCPVFISS